MNSRARGASSIAVAAALSVAILITAAASYAGEAVRDRNASAVVQAREPAQAQRFVPLTDADNNGIPDWQDELMLSGIAADASSTAPGQDPASSLGAEAIRSLISGYVSLKQEDAYTPAAGAQLADTIAESIGAPVAFTPHASDELTLTPDTSQTRILQYRADMRAAMAPMVDLTAEPEFSLFARFIATGDRSWLDKLSAVAARYHGVEKALIAVPVPQNAADVHLRAVNSLGAYADTLERLVRFSNDPLALLALLRTYNDAEREFILAFDALAKFYVENVNE